MFIWNSIHIGTSGKDRNRHTNQHKIQTFLIMQKSFHSFRMNDVQLIALSEKAIKEIGPRGYLQCRSLDSNKWTTRWYCLYQNLLFYFENDQCSKPLGVIFLEGSYCDKTIVHSSGKTSLKVGRFSNLFFVALIR